VLDEAEEALAAVESLAGMSADDVESGAADSAPDAETSDRDAEARKRETPAESDAESEAGPDAGPDAGSWGVAEGWWPSSGDGNDTAAGADTAGAAADSDAADDDEPGELPDQCPNCGALLDGPYCSQCGQKAAGRIKPLWHMMNEVLEAVFELDLRVLHTLPKFLFLPGRLTKEYVEGRRRRYVRPLRLYLFATFTLFTTLALLRPSDTPLGVFAPPSPTPPAADSVSAANPTLEGDGARRSGFLPGAAIRASGADQAAVLREVVQSLPDSIAARFQAGDSLRVDRLETWLQAKSQVDDGAPFDSLFADSLFTDSLRFAPSRWQNADGPNQQDGQEAEGSLFGPPEQRARLAQSIRESSIQVQLTGDSLTNERIERRAKEKAARAVEEPGRFVGEIIDRMPYMMFLMLPVFAFLLKLLYVRHGRLFMEHLIFTLHVHALTFFAFTAGVLMEEWGSPWVQQAGVWVLASPLLYLILAMRTVYRQGFFKTLFKANILLTSYLTILSLGLALLAVVTILLF
jgi:hypothetical protein